MNILDLGRTIIEGGKLEDKLVSYKIQDINFPDSYDGQYLLKEHPARVGKLKFDNKQLKFPKKGSLHLPEKRAISLHFFANHELLAIEMMAAALLIFPHKTKEDLALKQDLLSTIIDEQKHFSLYEKRMNELGLEFGDLPLSDFFWRYMDQIKTPEQFYCVVALTFEAANLDFAKYYKQVFADVDDITTAKIMNIVYIDEISHVARGQRWLNKKDSNSDLWKYFCSHLPKNLTPDRSKGISFDREGREKAGLDINFIDNVYNYKSDFNITNRKQWKK